MEKRKTTPEHPCRGMAFLEIRKRPCPEPQRPSVTVNKPRRPWRLVRIHAQADWVKPGQWIIEPKQMALNPSASKALEKSK
jgi:hypothetical protein